LIIRLFISNQLPRDILRYFLVRFEPKYVDIGQDNYYNQPIIFHNFGQMSSSNFKVIVFDKIPSEFWIEHDEMKSCNFCPLFPTFPFFQKESQKKKQKLE
jgi:hypothetical protein